MNSHTEPTGKVLTIYDATALLFRSYYGMGKVSSPEGFEVGALLGVGQRLTALMERQRPEHVAVVFDAGKKTFRNEIDPLYKANRGEPPEDMLHQFDLEKEMITALGFACFCVVGYEADDLMATLATMARNQGVATQLVSVDKDLCQLVRDEPPSIFLYDPKRGVHSNEEGVKDRLGVYPHQVIDYFALLGDTSDNVPGVKGVGPKTAQALIEEFGTLETIYDNLNKVGFLPIRRSKSLVQTLEQGKPNAWLSRTLVTLKHDVDLGISEDELLSATKWQGPTSQADELFDRLGFHRPLGRLHRLADVLNDQ